MQTKDAIRYSLDLADMAVMRALDQVEDLPLAFPTERGGCHPLWVVGHLAEVRARYTELRRANLAFLDALGEADLDTPTRKQPAGLEQHFATYGKALLTIALHQMAHRGQLTDTFRRAGRAEPALAA